MSGNVILILSAVCMQDVRRIEEQFCEIHRDARKILRHSTGQRSTSTDPEDGSHFYIEEGDFRSLIESRSFLEFQSRADEMTGTSIDEVFDAWRSSPCSILTVDPDTGLTLEMELNKLGVTSVHCFVAPCSLDVFMSSRSNYVSAALRRLMHGSVQGRNIGEALARVDMYRDLFLLNVDRMRYIEYSVRNPVDTARALSVAVSSLRAHSCT